MKKLFTILFVGLFVNISLSQTSTFTVQYLDVKQGAQNDLAALYDSFFEGVEFKTGGLYLERMDRGDVLGTHRIVYFGELGNSGMVDGSKTREEWQKFWEDRREFIEERGPRYSGRIAYTNGVDPFSKGYFQLYEAEVSDPAKFTEAHIKAIENIWSFEGNAMLFGSYDVGNPGTATHFAAYGADNLEALMKWKVYVEQNTEGMTEYFSSRGEVKELGNFSLQILKQYGGF
tara:strand:+ start:543 stop:1235 length:693 start_codon:yes stop_codon:yes gene_type:complete